MHKENLHLESESKQALKFGSNNHSVTISLLPAPNYGNNFSLPLIIFTKTDILIK